MTYYMCCDGQETILGGLDPVKKDKTPSPAKEDEICSAVLLIEVVALHIRILP